MKHCKMFVVALLLVITAMTACAPNKGKKASTVTGDAGNFLVIKGHGFSKDKAANRVIFGEKAAQVLQADSNYLLVQIPTQQAGTVQVVVAVGNNTSNAMLFEYMPKHKLVAAVKELALAAY
ncbi:IPT/TIG domain-containing protein [Chitinophaga solisilvae]|uniref:IPT/TIG domain-containing protein n=1 Tax=Chitinophaga solisilvae TaxID=1233460 RepID=UPI00136E256D|nr:IPT/TIG domain-containing protein [Chitinophaga solisilvae]